MKPSHSTPPTPATDLAPATPLKRRGLLMGFGAAGAAVVAAKVLPGAVVSLEPTAVGVTTATVGDGYQLTAHVLQYYDTARI